jgi:cytochrome d ubiquinol oxidase subunit I
MTYFTLLGFMGLYLLLGLLYLLLFARIVHHGPAHADERHLASVGTGGA